LPLLELPEAQWHEVIALNLTALYNCLRAQLRVMAGPGGSIINLASVYGGSGEQLASAFAAAKHGVIGLSRAVALEYGARGVRVNAVAPSFVRSGMAGKVDDATFTRLKALNPLGRFPTAEDVAAMVSWLGSEDAVMVSGSVQLADAGYTAA
jgi:NAD(P)-dependent dehydrogenase (short-subunit alcohol dehydrogenase family)